MGRMDDTNLVVPDGSIYFWMYEQGLKRIPLEEVADACRMSGVSIRPKDEQNYWNGWYRSSMNNSDVFTLAKRVVASSAGFLDKGYLDYPVSPFAGMPEIERRWIPCSKDNKPMFAWANKCLSIVDAKTWPKQVYLAENTKGTQQIIIDCDGDHGDSIDIETVMFLWKYTSVTHTISKPKKIKDYENSELDLDMPASFHLTFKTDRIVPTMHFPYAGIDIVGNEKNSLRYWKNKVWNGKQPIEMTEEIWSDLQHYIKMRKERANEQELARSSGDHGRQEDNEGGVRQDHA